MPRNPERPDDLYVIESSCHWFKIGRSHDVQTRLASLVMSCPPSVTLTLLATVRGYGSCEDLIHEAFAEHRGRGEWFGPSVGNAIRRAIDGDLKSFADRLSAANGRALPLVPPLKQAPRRSRIYARCRRLWFRVKKNGLWMSAPTPYNVGQEDLAVRYAQEAQRRIDDAAVLAKMPPERI